MIRSFTNSALAFKSMFSITLLSLLLTGCGVQSHKTTERYVSPTIEGATQRINLDEVEKAFFSTKGKDLPAWMSAFEKRVNEIYEGSDVVSVDATRDTGKLKVVGFVDKNKEPGYQEGEDKLFSLEQTGDVVNDKMPYQVSDERGNPYHQGHYSLFGNPFVQALVIGHMFNSFGPRYYTPYAQHSVLQNHRNGFRGSSSYTNQREANSQFGSRYKEKATGGFASKTGFGSRSTSPGASRSWSSPGTTSSPSASSSPWGGRRSGSIFGGGSRRGWGGRRR